MGAEVTTLFSEAIARQSALLPHGNGLIQDGHTRSDIYTTLGALYVTPPVHAAGVGATQSPRSRYGEEKLSYTGLCSGPQAHHH